MVIIDQLLHSGQCLTVCEACVVWPLASQPPRPRLRYICHRPAHPLLQFRGHLLQPECPVAESLATVGDAVALPLKLPSSPSLNAHSLSAPG